MTDDIQDAEEASQAPESSAQPRSKHIVTLMFVFLATTIICAVGWYNAYNPAIEEDLYKNVTYSWGNKGTVLAERWKATGARAGVWLDLNYDLNFEKGSYYNFADQLIQEEYDDNENGYPERSLRYSKDSKLRYEYLDKDEDGWYERMLSYGHTLTVEYKDSDFDSEYDSIYVYENNIIINSLTVAEMGKFFKTYRDDSTALNR